MTVVIRMKRTGRKNRPAYKISVADSRSPRDGRVIESVGFYDPISRNEAAQLKVNVERAKYWVSVGAQPSDTVKSMFKRMGVYGVPPTKVKRDRSGRKLVTKKKQHRAERDKRVAEAKAARPRIPRKPKDDKAKKPAGS
jgi:small subunit ribosomal protein S16